MNDKLELIRQKCIAANPEITKRRFYEGSGIRLADVLLAINKKPLTGNYYGIDCEGYFVAQENDHEGIGLKTYWDEKGDHQINFWNLRADDLEKQSEETISFLYEWLK